MADTKRYVADCRLFPSATNCSLTIAGTEGEVLDCAVAHAISAHGHPDTPELRETIRGMLREERAVAPVA
ncbi:MAG: DUF1059 domain-containing protein [Pseudomonadota bacterium]|nr:DUF1059 domain-containing protein [Pseudomonadota bacterium]